MTTLLTGGAGYIGAHVAAALLEAGQGIVIVDNESCSTGHNVAALSEAFQRPIDYHRFDVRERDRLAATMRDHRVTRVIHLAAFKSVGESVEKPIDYFDNNIGGAVALLAAMAEAGVERLLFSSSATVYGLPQYLPLDEGHPLAALNPYGQTKLTIEQLIGSFAASRPGFAAINLRYFNPIGFHPSIDLREDGPRLPDNLVPHILAALGGQIGELSVFGDDYDTPDGSCLRDYLHVVDVAEGHRAALDRLDVMTGGVDNINLGRGVGVSVFELVEAFGRIGGREVPRRVVGRRAGDAPAMFADPTKAKRELGWSARLDLDAMVRDSLRQLGAAAKTG